MVSFDRAASYYDATRGLPSDVGDALADLLTEELGGRGLCLEIGVGTGRIALPLHQRGIPLMGTDIAPAMLNRLVAKTDGRQQIPVALSDAARLAIRDSSVGAVLASHVLHLISTWHDAVDEAMRVLSATGVFLVDFGGHLKAPWASATEAEFHSHGIFRIRPGVSERGAVGGYLGKRAVARPLAPLRFVVGRSLAQDIEDWESQIQSWTWRYSSDRVQEACADIRKRARDEDWALDEVVQLEHTVQWWAFDRTS
jgi:ubiquinone/menaquinone biosynthesis C-methylase UbiE